jgi:VanZ family protein
MESPRGRSGRSSRGVKPLPDDPSVRVLFQPPPHPNATLAVSPTQTAAKPASVTLRLACVLALVTIFIIYGSLYPFVFHPHSDVIGPLQTLIGTVHDWDGRGDLLSNILLYMPFGFFATHTLPARVPAVVRALLAIAAGTLLSTCMELSQFYDEGRVTSMGDVYANAIGSTVGASISAFLGAGIRFPFVRELGANPDASLLLAMFLGYRLYPYVPMIDLHKYLRAVDGLRHWQDPASADLARFVVTWLFIAAIVEALYGFRRWFLLFPALVLGVFVGRIMIVDLSLTSADVVGAAIAAILWAGPLRWLPGRPLVLAALFAGLIITLRLQPFTFSPVPTHDFGWVPFWSLMNGSISVAMQAFFEKFYQYGGLIWLVRMTGTPLGWATGLTATLLLLTSIAEVYLPGRSAEITDATMAVAIGLAFHLLRNAAQPKSPSPPNASSAIEPNPAASARSAPTGLTPPHLPMSSLAPAKSAPPCKRYPPW